MSVSSPPFVCDRRAKGGNTGAESCLTAFRLSVPDKTVQISVRNSSSWFGEGGGGKKHFRQFEIFICNSSAKTPPDDFLPKMQANVK